MLLLVLLGIGSQVLAVKNAQSIIIRTDLVKGVKGRIYYYPPRLNGGAGVYHRIAIERLPRTSNPGRFVEIGWVKTPNITQYQTLIGYGITGTSGVYRNVFISVSQTPVYHDYVIERKDNNNLPRHEFYVDGNLVWTIPRADQIGPCPPGFPNCNVGTGTNITHGDRAGAGGEVLSDKEDMFGILSTGDGAGTIINGLQWKGKENGVVAWYNWSGTTTLYQDPPYYNTLFPNVPTTVVDCGTGTPAGAPTLVYNC